MQGGNGQARFSVSRGYANYVFVILFLLYVFDYIDRLVVSSVFPFLKSEWGVSDTQCGLLVSVVYWSVLAFVFPASILIDRWSRKKSIGIMAVTWSLATAACAFTGNFRQLIATRTIVGIGEAGYVPGGLVLIAAYFPEGKRAFMNGIFNAAMPLGCALGIAIGGVIAMRFGWRYAFGLVALPGLIVALMVFFIRDFKTVALVKSAAESTHGSGKKRMHPLDIARGFIATPSLICTYLGYAGIVFITTALLSWLPSYYVRMEGMAVDSAGIKASAIMIMAVIGAPLGGMITDRLRRRRLNARMLFPAASSLCASALFFAAFFFFKGMSQYAVLLAGGMVVIMFVAGASAVTQDVAHPGLRAMAYSLAVLIQNLLGASLGPLFVGAISDAYGLETAFILLPLAPLFSAVVFFIGSFYYVRDLNRAEKVTLVEER